MEVDVSRDRAAADEMVRLTGQLGVPVTVIDGQVVVGFNKPHLEQLLAIGGGQRPHLGLKVADASKIAQKAGEPPLFGAYIGAVAPSSLGERAGLRSGDIIREVNLRPIRDAEDLERALSGLTPGSRVTIIFLREGETSRSEIVI
jgi:S1-C subfamily serine protease